MALLLAPDSCYLHPRKPIRRIGLVTGKKSGRTLVKQVLYCRKIPKTFMRPGALLQNLRGRNIQGKQIATSPHQTLQKMTEITFFTHWTDSASIFRAAESSPVCACHHIIASKMLCQDCQAVQPRVHKSGLLCLLRIPTVKPQPPSSKQCMCYKSEASNFSPTHSIQSRTEGRTIQVGQKYYGFIVFNYPVQQRNTKIFKAFLKNKQTNNNEAI